jgi:hypothetical protein
MQGLESRGWGMASSILAMVPVNAGGLMLLTAGVIYTIIWMLLEDGPLALFFMLVFLGLETAWGVGIGIWNLITLANTQVIEGFDYKEED